MGRPASMHDPEFPAPYALDVVADASNPSIQEVEAEVSEVQSHLQLYNQFEISFDNLRPCLLYGNQAGCGEESRAPLWPRYQSQECRTQCLPLALGKCTLLITRALDHIFPPGPDSGTTLPSSRGVQRLVRRLRETCGESWAASSSQP